MKRLIGDYDLIKHILEQYRTVAIIGLSQNPTRSSHRVAKYLKSQGYTIIPINPFVDEVLGRTSYQSLLDAPKSIQQQIEIVNVFRPSQEVPLIVDQSIHIKEVYGKPNVIWMQLGITSEVAAKRAVNAGFDVVMNKCIMIEHARYFGGSIGTAK